MNPSERHMQSKGATLNSQDLRGSYAQPWGGNLLPRVSWLPRLEASHMICFSHQRERDCPQPLICFSHDLDLWVLPSVFLMDTKRFYTVVFLGQSYAVLKGNRKYQTFSSSSGYPPAIGNYSSTCVEDNESSCALD